MKGVLSAGLALWVVLAPAVLYTPRSAGSQEVAPRVDAVVIRPDLPLCASLPASQPRAHPEVLLTPWIQGFFTGYNSHKPPGSRFILIDEHKHAIRRVFDYCRGSATKTLVEAAISVIEFHNKQRRAQQLIKPSGKEHTANAFVATDRPRIIPVFSPGEPVCGAWLGVDNHSINDGVEKYIQGFATAYKVYGPVDAVKANDVGLPELIEGTRNWCGTHRELLVASGIWEELRRQR